MSTVLQQHAPSLPTVALPGAVAIAQEVVEAGKWARGPWAGSPEDEQAILEVGAAAHWHRSGVCPACLHSAMFASCTSSGEGRRQLAVHRLKRAPSRPPLRSAHRRRAPACAASPWPSPTAWPTASQPASTRDTRRPRQPSLRALCEGHTARLRCEVVSSPLSQPWCLLLLSCQALPSFQPEAVTAALPADHFGTLSFQKHSPLAALRGTPNAVSSSSSVSSSHLICTCPPLYH